MNRKFHLRVGEYRQAATDVELIGPVQPACRIAASSSRFLDLDFEVTVGIRLRRDVLALDQDPVAI